jgi:predicted nucleic acid-binding protein
MARYLIDTDVLIDVSRGSAAAARFVDSIEDITISIITAHELIVGARNHRDAAAIDGLIEVDVPDLDTRGQWVAEPRYDLASEFSEGLAWVPASSHTH